MRNVRRSELKQLELMAPGGRNPKLPTGASPTEYWRAHDRLYPGGSQSSREWTWLSEAIRERDGHTCCVCVATTGLQVDHIRPLSKGGRNEYENLWTLCGTCHSAKTGRAL